MGAFGSLSLARDSGCQRLAAKSHSRSCLDKKVVNSSRGGSPVSAPMRLTSAGGRLSSVGTRFLVASMPRIRHLACSTGSPAKLMVCRSKLQCQRYPDLHPGKIGADATMDA